MTKRERSEYTDRQRLRDNGWGVRKRDAVAFNSGSETLDHYCCKAIVAKVLKERGWRVDSEVEKAGVGEIDVVAYGSETDAEPFAVEVETNPEQDVIADKLDRYHDGEPFREVFVIDPTDMPDSLEDAAAWLDERL